MNWLKNLIDRFANWYWRDPIAAQRHQIEEKARQFGGSVTWRQ